MVCRYGRSVSAVWSRALVLFVAAQFSARAAVSLRPSHPTPWQVGGVVTWTASPSTGAPDDYWYRFRSRRVGLPFRVWKDYGPGNTFEWTAADRPGTFELRLATALPTRFPSPLNATC